MARQNSFTLVLLSTLCFLLTVGVVMQRGEARMECLYKLYPTGCEPDECKDRCLEQHNITGYCQINRAEDGGAATAPAAAAAGGVIDIGDYDYSCWCVIYCANKQGRGHNATEQIGD